MKKFLTKIGYMAFGSLLTIVGYHFGNVDNNSVNAQETFQTPVEIVDKLRVRQLEIVGNDNSPRIYLGTDLDRGQIKFVSDSDTSQISLKATSHGGQIKLHNVSGKHKISLSLTGDGRGSIMIGEKAGVVLTETDNGGVVVVDSEDEKSMVTLQALKSGGFVVMATDPSGGSALLGATDGGGVFQVSRKDIAHAVLSSNSDGGILELYDKSGKTLIHAGVTDESNGFLVTFNKDGTITNSMGGNSIGGTSTSTYKYKKEVLRTRSIPLLRLKEGD